MGKVLPPLLAFVAAIAIVFYLLTMPVTVPESALPSHEPDLANGKYMFTAAAARSVTRRRSKHATT